MRSTVLALVHPGGMCRLAELTIWEETRNQTVPFSHAVGIYIDPAMARVLLRSVVV